MKITGEDGVTRVYAVHKGIVRIVQEYKEDVDLHILNWIIGPPLILTGYVVWD